MMKVMGMIHYKIKILLLFFTNLIVLIAKKQNPKLCKKYKKDLVMLQH